MRCTVCAELSDLAESTMEWVVSIKSFAVFMTLSHCSLLSRIRTNVEKAYDEVQSVQRGHVGHFAGLIKSRPR